MIKNNRIAIGVFLILVLFNSLFPPIILFADGIIQERHFFRFLFDIGRLYQVDVKTLILLFLITLIISVIVQFVFRFFKMKFNKNR